MHQSHIQLEESEEKLLQLENNMSFESDGTLKSCDKLHKASKKISKDLSQQTFKQKFTRRSWTKQEDDQLIQQVQIHGQNWGLISQNLGGSRSGKQIRDRYLNKLHPSISNSKWSDDEDEKLLTLFKLHGRKWSEISKNLPGRSETMVKNRFYCKYKEYLSGSKEPSKEIIQASNESISQYVSPSSFIQQPIILCTTNQIGITTMTPEYDQHISTQVNCLPARNDQVYQQLPPEQYQNLNMPPVQNNFSDSFLKSLAATDRSYSNQTQYISYALPEYNCLSNGHSDRLLGTNVQTDNHEDVSFIDFNTPAIQKNDYLEMDELGSQSFRAFVNNPHCIESQNYTSEIYAQENYINPPFQTACTGVEDQKKNDFNLSAKELRLQTLINRLSEVKNVYWETMQEIQQIMNDN